MLPPEGPGPQDADSDVVRQFKQRNGKFFLN